MANSEAELLLSLPPNMNRHLSECEPAVAASAFGTCDPPGRPLGSGGGTAHVLAEAWKSQGQGRSFQAWLADRRKIIIHGGGQSRRLPAYAGPGKLFIPVPAYRWSLGQRLDQSLLDLQLPFAQDVVSKAGAQARVAIVSGDVLLRSEVSIPSLPDADVVLLGLWARPEEAQHFGVMFCDRTDPSRLRFFLQKPSPDRIRELAAENLFMIDVGLWLLSERAVMCLMEKCGWNAEQQDFRTGQADTYDLYGAWGPHFGEHPDDPDSDVGKLTTAVVTIPEGAFYHFGKSRDIIRSVYDLQNLVVDQTRFGRPGTQPHPRQFVQNADFGFPLRQDSNHSLWVENSMVPASWKLGSEHVLTGVPDNDWELELPSGVCLDFSPIGESDYAVRPYGIDDPFRGAMGDAATPWLGSPIGEWLRKRDLTLAQAGLAEDCDIQDAPLFPVLTGSPISADFVRWMCADEPDASPECRAQWLDASRLSATEIARDVNLVRLYAARRARMRDAVLAMAGNYRRSVFYRLDLEHAASLLAEHDDGLAALPVLTRGDSATMRMHDRMLRAQVMQLQCRHEESAAFEREAFECLRDAIVTPVMEASTLPRCAVVADQIVWGRAPARLDLAGGWTDTPPYCLERGGAVLNLAVNLNGQPPIQVFARVIEEKALVIRSIDLGLSESLTSYEEVGAYDRLSSGFAIARAAFALVGFEPRFNGGRYPSLEAQLTAFGGGIEISMLAAIPKGSGLGTSSILAGTLLGTLADLCDLGWDRSEISRRTLA
ncbi:MAG: bifunctional fucokinase/L-fucose-1-P-guanylyltransferase, partial [Verrucomicrobia bacterium]|nr:bifunctional fucokinase/L-fucose-1-P-guanylyltransferase [Verrucomicrobiota bacterium]